MPNPQRENSANVYKLDLKRFGGEKNEMSEKDLLLEFEEMLASPDSTWKRITHNSQIRQTTKKDWDEPSSRYILVTRAFDATIEIKESGYHVDVISFVNLRYIEAPVIIRTGQVANWMLLEAEEMQFVYELQ